MKGLVPAKFLKYKCLEKFHCQDKDLGGGGGGVSTPLLVIIAGHMTSDQLESAKSVH